MTHATPHRRWLTRRVLAWSLYDVASSTFFQIVPTFFGLYFVTQVTGGRAASGAWGLAAAASVAMTGIVAPIAGAYADRTARWIPVLAGATALCVISTLALPLASLQGAVAAATAFVCAQLGYALATSLYDSYVVDVAPPPQRSRVSAFGWSTGLAGGMLAGFIALWMLRGVPAGAQVERLGAVFVMVGLLFGALALPGIAGLRGLRGRDTAIGAHGALLASLRRVVATLRDWRAHRPALQVLTAYFLINDVLVTMQFFIVIVLSARFGLSVEGLLWLAVLYSAIAIPSTLLAGRAADRLGARRVLVAMCLILGAAIVLLALADGAWVPVATVVLLGLVVSSTQANFRSLYASQVSAGQAAEMFGFNVIAGRLSAALGPLAFGAVVTWLGSNAVALILLLVPLAVGVVVLLRAHLADSGDRSHGNAGAVAAGQS